MKKVLMQGAVLVFACVAVVAVAGYAEIFPLRYAPAAAAEALGIASSTPTTPPVPTLDKAAFDARMFAMAHIVLATSTPTTATSTVATSTKVSIWPAKAPYPNAGALLPFNRIVAYYGNFYSKGMGVLGQYPPDEMITRLKAAVAQWQAADPSTPVMPAIDYIAVTAQASAGKDGKYRARMPTDQIQKAVDLAAQVNGIVILDVQVGLSNAQTEVPLLANFLKLPNVELALDPEFAMQASGKKPGGVIGTMDAAEINWAANYLAGLVRDNNLPPKILVIHRFTEDMVTHYKKITPLPEVEVVMDMDGWGFPAKKINTYNSVVASEPVQFTGFKLFYKNDLKAPSTRLLTPAEVLKLTPSPVFIQYQ